MLSGQHDRRSSLTRVALCVLVLILGLATTRAITPSSVPTSGSAGGSDAALFRGVVDAMRAGSGYYDAMNETLRRMRYPTASVFNWRTPMLYRFLTTFSTWEQTRVLLVLLSTAACIGAVAVGITSSIPAFVTIAISAPGVVLMMSAPGAVGMAESWAGCLIALSICAYRFDRYFVGVLLGATALFVRELTVPFVAICGLIALRKRRWAEVIAWTAIAVAYGLYYWNHWEHVAAQQLPGDITHARSWIAWGGVGFLLSAVNWQAILVLTPWFLTVLTLALITAGILSPAAPGLLRLTAATYSLLFLIVGQNFNEYWGLLVWPTWLMAEGFGTQTLISDIRTALR
jgi:hypothetical protein